MSAMTAKVLTQQLLSDPDKVFNQVDKLQKILGNNPVVKAIQQYKEKIDNFIKDIESERSILVEGASKNYKKTMKQLTCAKVDAHQAASELALLAGLLKENADMIIEDITEGDFDPITYVDYLNLLIISGEQVKLIIEKLSKAVKQCHAAKIELDIMDTQIDLFFKQKIREVEAQEAKAKLNHLWWLAGPIAGAIATGITCGEILPKLKNTKKTLNKQLTKLSGLMRDGTKLVKSILSDLTRWMNEAIALKEAIILTTTTLKGKKERLFGDSEGRKKRAEAKILTQTRNLKSAAQNILKNHKK